MQDIINESAADYVVCHITVEGDAAGEAFDEHLELLARQFLGTRFIRCPVQPNSQLPLHFGLEFPSGEHADMFISCHDNARSCRRFYALLFHFAAGVICFHRGDLIGSMLLDREADGEAHDPDVIESWLRRKGCVVSLEGAADVPNRPGHDPTAAADASEDEGDDEPCEVCGRRYPHQHIRSVYRTTVDDSDND